MVIHSMIFWYLLFSESCSRRLLVFLKNPVSDWNQEEKTIWRSK